MSPLRSTKRKRSRNCSLTFLLHKLFLCVLFISCVWIALLFSELSSNSNFDPNSKSNPKSKSKPDFDSGSGSPLRFPFFRISCSPLHLFQRFLLSNELNAGHSTPSTLRGIRLDHWLRRIQRSFPLKEGASRQASSASSAASEIETPSKLENAGATSESNAWDIFDGLEDRSTPPKPGSCLNTVQGKDLITDDRGVVCKRRHLVVSTGCCPPPSSANDRFSCQTCDLPTKCCTVYEHCVSCCQNPVHVSEEQARAVPVSRQLFSVNYSSVFEFCRGRCRHYSQSVVHENSYASEFHHCFDVPETASPSNSSSTTGSMQDQLEGLRIIVAPPGNSCLNACSSRNGLRCEESKLSLLNNCHMLQKFFHCSGSCIGSFASDQPSEVVHSAPVHVKPGACLYSEGKRFSCDGSNPFTRRLCPCVSSTNQPRKE